MPGRRHRNLAHAILPQELVENDVVGGVGVREVKLLPFLPVFLVHLIEQTIFAIAVVRVEGGLRAGPTEERSHHGGAGIIGVHWRNAQEGFDKFRNQAREAAKDMTGTVTGLPNARAVTGHERCATAANGAPDCQAAAHAVCRGKGFQTGKSLDTQSELKCPAKLLLERRAPNDKDCLTEIFITRAMCQ